MTEFTFWPWLLCEMTRICDFCNKINERVKLFGAINTITNTLFGNFLLLFFIFFLLFLCWHLVGQCQVYGNNRANKIFVRTVTTTTMSWLFHTRICGWQSKIVYRALQRNQIATKILWIWFLLLCVHLENTRIMENHSRIFEK